MAQVLTHHATPALGAAWQRFAAQMVVQRDATGQARFWTPESAERTFHDTTIIEPSLNRGFFTAIPGMVTGAGLLCTFVAILLSLLDVTLENEQFRGLDMLISGLSGKFLSSIAALCVATLYTFFEKRLLHSLSQGVHALGVLLDELVPRLTPASLLASMHERLEAQTATWHNLHRDLGSAIQQGLEASMGAALARMVQRMDDLSQWLRSAEAQRTDTASERLEGLLQHLGTSLTASLGELSTHFAHSLSQSASQEFESVVSALRGAAQLLTDMNTQFLSMQGAFGNLMELAKTSTVEQMAAGKTQVEDIAGLLREMMTHIQDSTGSSVQHMATTLTTVVHDLSAQVAAMSQRLDHSMTSSAGKVSQTTQRIIGQVDQWTTQHAQQLTQLLAHHQTQLAHVQDVHHTMGSALGQFQSALREYAAITAGLKTIATETNTVAAATTGATQALTNASAVIERVATMATTQADRLAAMNRHQEEVQQRMLINLQHYQQLFHEVENAASTLMAQVDQHLRQYMATTQQGFMHLTQAADVHFANASQHLGDTVQGLDEHLQDLTDILERFGRGGAGHGHP